MSQLELFPDTVNRTPARHPRRAGQASQGLRPTQKVSATKTVKTSAAAKTANASKAAKTQKTTGAAKTTKVSKAAATTRTPRTRGRSAPARAQTPAPAAPPTKAAVQDAAGDPTLAVAPRPNGMPPYEVVALVLQGGGALGAYQAGVIEGLLNAGIEPDYISGISIGALNTAIIAGNPPEKRIERLREFWETICQPNSGLGLMPFVEETLFGINDTARTAVSAMQAGAALLGGQQGFFQPRFPPPSMVLPGRPEEASYYDTSALKATLERLCDFDRINAGPQHVSVGAVNVRTGNFVYFDNKETVLRPEHFMASGALPPAFAAVEIDGEYYWDGGLVSNTPLAQILKQRPPRDTLVFQVDLWSARGQVPGNMSEVSDRIKDIQYSSRTRMITEQMRWEQYLRHMLHRLLQQLPEDGDEENLHRRLANDLGCSKRYNVIHLIYRNQPYERHYKDYQFGPSTMRAHWAGGLDDIRDTLARPGVLDMPDNASGFVTHDIHRNDIEQAWQAVDKSMAGAS